MHCPIGLRDAVLLVAGFPVSPLAVSTAVHHETTPCTGRKLGSSIASFRCLAVSADWIAESMALFAFLFCRHGGQPLCLGAPVAKKCAMRPPRTTR
jgi:hypothetical protein